jgi:hypothetical protein
MSNFPNKIPTVPTVPSVPTVSSVPSVPTVSSLSSNYSKQFIIQYNDQTIDLTPGQALEMELKLNICPKKDLYKTLGDQLYDYHSKNKNNKIFVTSNDYEYLYRLSKISFDKYKENRF